MVDVELYEKEEPNMTEAEWAASKDPTPMLEFLRGRGGASDRKLRLFAVACCRQIWPLLADERSSTAVDAAESFADGTLTSEQLKAAVDDAWRALGKPGGWAAAYAGTGHIITPVKAAWVTSQAAAGVPAGEYGKLQAQHASYVGYDIASAEAEGHTTEVIPWASHLTSSRLAPANEDPAIRLELEAQAALLRCIFGPLPFRSVLSASFLKLL
jgi:hypothetical protein